MTSSAKTRFELFDALVGGLARFSSMTLAHAFESGLVAPLAAELVVLPALGLWALRSHAPLATSSERH